MLKNILFSLILCGSVSLCGATKKLTHEEKIAKRVQKVLESKEDLISGIKSNIEELQGLLQNVIAYTEKEGLDNELLEKLNDFLVNVITRLKEGQDNYFESLTTVFKAVHRCGGCCELLSKSYLY